MNDEELKRLWCGQKLDAPTKLSPGDQIKLMRIKTKALDRAYLWCDTVIIGISALVLLFFAWHLLKTTPLVARIGLVIMIATHAFDIWKTIRVRRVLPQPPTDAPVTQWLRHELEKVRARSKLTRTMLWWDLLPFWVGAIVFTWGLDIALSSQIFFSAFFTGISVILYVSRWKLTQYTWRKADLPLIEELESLLKSNTPE
jgi:hypothetical protein